ncbi:Zinc finger, RING-CH-type [Artemisia annua]|uniref:Zinc finger, RING-CH-type n=1 Tax=Artemisia annua TaxID=35608 RepID=A0A2U1KY48_ARTAN|nr:Zinc finger, RING-CH-type [Artemisia annua]
MSAENISGSTRFGGKYISSKQQAMSKTNFFFGDTIKSTPTATTKKINFNLTPTSAETQSLASLTTYTPRTTMRKSCLTKLSFKNKNTMSDTEKAAVNTTPTTQFTVPQEKPSFMRSWVPDFSVAEFDDQTVMLCYQCEKEYHAGCLRESGRCDIKVRQLAININIFISTIQSSSLDSNRGRFQWQWLPKESFYFMRKAIKADLAFAKERCGQLEEENRILTESSEGDGDNPEDEDLVCLVSLALSLVVSMLNGLVFSFIGPS